MEEKAKNNVKNETRSSKAETKKQNYRPRKKQDSNS